MLYVALTFLILSLSSAAMGFSGILGEWSAAAQISFVISLLLYVVTLVAGSQRREVP